MPEQRTVVTNTTPLLYLHQVGRLEILRALYSEVVVPEQVVAELGAGGGPVPEIASHEWLTVRNVSLPDSIRMVPDLGSGEAGTIALCLTSPNPLALLDDGLARRIARLHGIPVTGTAGVLLKSKESGHIPAVRPVLTDMIEAGFYLRPDHLELICRMAGEQSA